MQKVAVLAASMLVAGASHAVQFDPPDLSLEFQLHQKYLASKGMAPNPTSGTSESYRLQKGETLWTLSEMLYGDGHYWPRVWAQNRGIANPNLVRQGHMLQFILGSEDQTPAFRFTEDDDGEGVELAAGPGQNPIVEIPPPEVPPKPVLKIPGSFPEWQAVFAKPMDKWTDFAQLGKRRGAFAGRMYLTSYVQEAPLQGIGEFLEADIEGAMPLANQYVYVKMLKGVGQPGMKLLFAQDLGPLKRLNNQWDERVVAHMIQIAGQLQLTEEAPNSFKKFRDREDYTAWRALVTHSTGLALKGTKIIEGSLEVIDMTASGSAGTASAQVIGSWKSAASAVFGQGDLIFLNKGSSHGLERGQLLNVYADRQARQRDVAVRYSTAKSGLIKIVRVSDRLATGVVVHARESIQQGDQVREASASGAESERFEPAPAQRRREFTPEGTDEDLEQEIEDEM